MFINCANYSTTIKEEEPIDTFVIQVSEHAVSLKN